MLRKKVRGGKTLVFLCSLVYFASYFTRKDFAAATAGMLAANVFEKPEAGLIGTALFALYGFGQIVCGLLGDKIAPEKMILTGLGTTLVCNALLPFVPSPALMIPLWGINGFAQAMLWPPIVHLLAAALDHEAYVRANLIVTSAAHIATILLYLYVPICLEFFDWKFVFLSAAALALLAFLIFFFALLFTVSAEGKEEVSRRPTEKESGGKGFMKVLIGAGILPVFAAIACHGFLRDGIESWLPTLYAEAFGRDASEATLVSVILPIFAILSISAVTAIHKTKFFSNEILGSVILFALSTMLCVPLFFLLGSENAAIRYVCLILAATVSASLHGLNFLIISCLAGRFSKIGRAATTSGFCNAFTYLGSAVSGYGIASIAEGHGWGATILTFGIVSFAGLVSCLLALKPYSAFIRENS